MLPELIWCVTLVLLQTCLKIEHPLRPPVHIFMLAVGDKFMFPGSSQAGKVLSNKTFLKIG